MSTTEYHPLTPDRRRDFEVLFGAGGACGGCWCMYHRLGRADYEANKGDGNKAAMERRVQEGRPPGILAYAGGIPVGWCSIAPREEFPRFAKAKVYRPVDDKPVWSINCLFVARQYRRRSVATGLIGAAVGYARKCGARIVEAYPVEPASDAMPDVFAFMGIASSFRSAGFQEVERRTPTRPVMRYTVQGSEKYE